MRRGLSGAQKDRLLALWLIVAVVCAAVLAVGQILFPGGDEAEETAIPNDYFAVPVTAPANGDAAAEDDATEAMMLKIVCLTFDDGPSDKTAEILEILQRYEVPATFFVTAQDANLDYLPLLSQTQAQGHQIALHSATHSYKKIYASTGAFWLDIKELRQAIAPYVDVESIHWLRFPGGSTNTVSHRYGGSGIMKNLIAETADKGYEWIDWNVCAEDATSSHPNAAKILENIQRDADGRDICVVLMHDTKQNGPTVEALPSIIEWFRQEGYHFCTVEEMYSQRDGG